MQSYKEQDERSATGRFTLLYVACLNRTETLAFDRFSVWLWEGVLFPTVASAVLYLLFFFVYVFIGVDLAGILRGTHGERRRWVGAEWGGVWWGVSSLQPTRGSTRPAENGFWLIFKATERSFLYYMTKIWGGQFALASPYSKFWGDLSPRPPWSTPMTTVYLWPIAGVLRNTWLSVGGLLESGPLPGHLSQ